MFGIESFSLFLVSCLVLNVTPGQDTFYIVGRSIAQGKRAGMASALGIMTGVLVHTLFAAMGLSVILATSSVAFSIVKYAGAAYLVWMGLQLLRNEKGHQEPSFEPGKGDSHWKLYRQGVLTNVLNPKVALFFLSFLPQFVSPGIDRVFIPFLLLGLVFFTTGSLWCLFLVYGASWLRLRFQSRSSSGAWLKRLSGALFIGLGLKLALTNPH